MEPVWWCNGEYWKKSNSPAEWYFANDRWLGVNKVSDFFILSLPPQELDIFGSMQSFACFFLNYITGPFANKKFGLDVSGTGIYANASAWCNHTLPQPITRGVVSIGLMDNIFLICGNRAWKSDTRKGYRRSLHFWLINHVSLLLGQLAICI